MGKKARTKCKFDGEIIEVGKRSTHLLEKHNYEVAMPPEKWLRKYGLPIIAQATKKDHNLRITLWKWMNQYFDYDS